MTRLISSLLLSAAFAAPLLAQGPRQWVRQLDQGGLDDEAFDVALDPAGNILLSGSSMHDGTAEDFLTAKYDAHGRLLWAQRYDGPGHARDTAWSITSDRFGNVITAGDSIGDGTGWDVAILKYSADGKLLWTRRYDGPAHGFDATQYGRCLATDAAGNILVCCTSLGTTSDLDNVTLKFTADGALMWERRYNGVRNSFDDAFGLIVDASGNVYVGGDTTDEFGTEDILIIKYDASGNLVWQQQFAGKGNTWDVFYAMKLDGDGNLLVAGATGYPEDYVVIKYDRLGNQLWASTYDGPESGWDVPFAIAVDRHGNVCVTGESLTHYDTALTTVMFDASGNQLWAQRYDEASGSYGPDSGQNVVFDVEGNVYVCGYGWNGFESGLDAITIKYAPNGTAMWVDTFDGAMHGDDALLHMVMGRSGQLYVAGMTMTGDLHQDALIIKFGGVQATSAMRTP